MLDRLLTPLLMLAAFVWTLAAFSSAGPLLAPSHSASAAASAPVELQRVVIVGKREAAPAALARNEAASPSGRSTQ